MYTLRPKNEIVFLVFCVSFSENMFYRLRQINHLRYIKNRRQPSKYIRGTFITSNLFFNFFFENSSYPMAERFVCVFGASPLAMLTVYM